MNERFVNVKVDREERPDVDAIYMDAVVALSGHGGWPMTVFLTPEREPFFGGTYFPPEPRHGLPGFPQLLVAVVRRVPRAARRRRRAQAQALVDAVRAAERAAAVDRAADRGVLDEAVRGAALAVRPASGAASGARRSSRPPSALEFLLRRGGARRMVDEDARRHGAGGMYDVVGGGFHRYSVDERWLVPHFEKMLYDNALLVARVSPRLGAHGRRALPRRRRADRRLPGPRAVDRGRGVRVLAGRRHGRRRGHDVHVGAGRGRAGGPARAVRARAIDRPRRARRGDARCGCSRSASSGRSRRATTR